MKAMVLFVAVLLLPAVPAIETTDGSSPGKSCQTGIINVTVSEVWAMLNSEEDGRQFVVDDRMLSEYFSERIATPHVYDKPVLYPLQLMELPVFADLFNALFNGKEVIIYCRSANRSWIGANLLVDNGFTGVLYNMAGGINEWKAQGLPTVKGFGFGG
jgi:rhodanese-related sulfurtransferase